MAEYILKLDGIKKSFDNMVVLKGIHLSIRQGEFITFLGASGCGKTTTLRIIAGLETPDEGKVFLDGQDVTALEPNQRNVNTVFQNYALFPHMNVFSNIAYGLRLKRLPKKEIAGKVEEMLELVQLAGYEKRMPSELSGGQKQRVAIARAVINNPQVLLLDEPLGALDLQLRRQMQIELKRIQKRLKITFIYITHDQEEALNMSDRIVVMNNGLLEQVGTPDDIYYHPRTSYVARFVGTANIFSGRLNRVENGIAWVEIVCHPGEPAVLAQAKLTAAQAEKNRLGQLKPGQKVSMAVRSENILLEKEPGPGLHLAVIEKNFAGGMLRICMDGGAQGELVSSRQGIDADFQAGDRLTARWEPEHGILVDMESM
ncbi:MAG: ABC transporter ATP-binding protein [Lachnospiraceae bacterium]|nr:ABC transporter ATP-binding protein [Lachnospiraceae bacterium]